MGTKLAARRTILETTVPPIDLDVNTPLTIGLVLAAATEQILADLGLSDSLAVKSGENRSKSNRRSHNGRGCDCGVK